MSGFTLYETLRILLPGVIGASIGHVTWSLLSSVEKSARVASIRVPAVADLLLAGLLFGLFMYLIDIPARFRMLKEGDPPGYPLPADAIGEILGKESRLERNLQLYWFLSDRYLPEEYHKRLYLAGALFKIFVDTRVLLVLASVVLCVAGWLVGPGSLRVGLDSFCIEVTCMFRWLIIPGAIASIGSFGLLTYRLNVFEKRKEHPSTWLSREVKEIWGVLGFLIVCGGLGTFLVMSSTWLSVIGVLLALVSFGTWLMVEIGPPKSPDTGDKGIQALRSSFLLKLGAQHNGTQYSQFQRLFCDLALIWPWSSLALVAVVRFEILYVMVAIVVMTSLAAAILSVRKHESRFLVFYKEQSAWFELHKSDLLTIGETGELPDRWE